MTTPLRRVSFLAALACLLAACSPDPDPNADPATASAESEPAMEAESDPASDGDTDPPLDRLIDDPQALREAMRDPEQRGALIAALRDRRQSDEARGQLRERMRERREEILARQDGGERGTMSRGSRVSPRGEWWNDESVAEELALAPEQIAALADAHQSVQAARLESRQMRAGSQRQLLGAIGQADRDQVEALIERRRQAAVEQARAEAEWLRVLIDQLDDDQLETLARSYPQLLLMRP
jgi:hypothetical protein